MFGDRDVLRKINVQLLGSRRIDHIAAQIPQLARQVGFERAHIEPFLYQLRMGSAGTELPWPEHIGTIGIDAVEIVVLARQQIYGEAGIEAADDIRGPPPKHLTSYAFRFIEEWQLPHTRNDELLVLIESARPIVEPVVVRVAPELVGAEVAGIVQRFAHGVGTEQREAL